MGRAILAVISAAAAIVGAATIFRSVYVLLGKSLEGDDYEPAEDFTDKLIEAGVGFIISAFVAIVLAFLYLIGVQFILPIFGL